MYRASAGLSPDGKRIEVRFPYSPVGVELMHEAGGSWSPAKRCWYLPLDLTSARRLRESWGAGLTLSDDLRRWGKDERMRRAMRRQLSEARSADLVRVPGLLPALAERLSSRPYQSADIARMALSNVLNANEPGTGKTIEVIGTTAEAGLLDLPTLTLCPRTAIVNTWAAELRRSGYPHTVLASESTGQRAKDLKTAAKLAAAGEPFWLVSNPDQLRVKPLDDDATYGVVVRDPVSGAPYGAPKPEWFGIPWGLVALDEFHMFGLTNPRSQFGLAARLLRARRLILASGTPIGGKYKRLWALLNYLYPEEYGSWWRWASQWLVITDNGFGKVVKDEIQPGREEEFQRAHAHHYLRRTKLADLPGCPAKVQRTIECGMTSRQERLYRDFERDAEVRLNGQRVTGHGILAEWTRLRAFANAACRVDSRSRVVATEDSGKLPYLLETLAEVGVRKRQPEPRARAIVGTMDLGFAHVVSAFLRRQGINTGLLVGGVEADPLVRRFESRDPAPYVLVMTIQTGGVSLNLPSAGSVHALDESWDPDHMTQFFDRGDRGARDAPLLCFTYRTRGTIQEYIAEVAGGKAINNANAYQFAARLRASGAKR